MSDLSDYYSVREAASELGVNAQRVRALIDNNTLDAEKIAGRWLILAASVRARKNNARRGGRPLSSASAWLTISSGLVPQILVQADEPARHNVRVQLGGRAVIRDVYVLPKFVPKLERVIVSVAGRALAEQENVPAGVDKRWVLDGYIRDLDLADLEAQKVITSVRGELNVRLRVIDGDSSSGAFNTRAENLLVAWLDLADENDRAADLAYQALVGELRSAGVAPFPLGNGFVTRLSLRLLQQISDELGSGDEFATR